MLLALVSGTVNAVDNLTSAIKEEEGFENYQISLIQTVGLFGLYFTFFSGLALDRFGPIKVSIVGAMCNVIGYLIMFLAGGFDYQASRGQEFGMVFCLIVGYSMVGLGSGTMFISAMSNAFQVMPTRPGLAVSLPGICMSLSMAFTIMLENNYASISDCTTCWSGYVLVLACTVTLFSGAGVICMSLKRFINKDIVEELLDDVDHHPELTDSSEEERKLKGQKAPALVTPSQSLLIFFSKFYWVLIFGFFCGISFGLIVVTQTTNLWNNFTGGDTTNDWTSGISVMFSVANSLANIVSGTLSDYLLSKGLSRSRFVSLYFIACSLLLGTLGILTGFHSYLDNTFWYVIYAMMLISVGFGWGFSFTMFPAVTEATYGAQNFGICYSYVNLGSLIASVVVPNLAGVLAEYGTGGFVALFFIFAILILLASVLLWVVKGSPVPTKLPGFASGLGCLNFLEQQEPISEKEP